MAEFFALREQVGARTAAGSRTARHSFDHSDAGLPELLNLVRVIGEEAKGAEPEGLEGLRRKLIIARVGGEPKAAIGFDGVEAGVLQLVRLDLVDQADTTALLRKVENEAAGFLRDFAQGKFELRAAVAAFR